MPSCDFLLVQSYEGIVLAKITRERILDPASITSLYDGLVEQLNRNPRISLVIDMSDVGYLSSAVLGKLVAIYKQVKAGKGRMALAGVKPALMPLFKVTSLDKLFEFHADAEQVILLYRRKPL